MQNTRGILLMVLAMAGFTVEDMLIKQLSVTLSVGQILVFLGFGASALLLCVVVLNGHSLLQRNAWSALALWRMLAEATAAVSLTTALWLVDFAVFAAVFQATPLVIIMGAALFLGEEVGWRRWTAVLIGFSGVLLIIRPGLAGFDPNALFVLITVVAITVRDLITRRMDVQVSTSILAFQGFAVMVPVGAVLLALPGFPPGAVTATEIKFLIGAVVAGALAYYALITATRIAPSAVITPFRYTRLLFSLIVAVIVFRERPDLLTLCGASLILITGLYTFFRERRLARMASA
ncbi:MAG: DMT family transporter [Pseudomonadota bacterium]